MMPISSPFSAASRSRTPFATRSSAASSAAVAVRSHSRSSSPSVSYAYTSEPRFTIRKSRWRAATESRGAIWPLTFLALVPVMTTRVTPVVSSVSMAAASSAGSSARDVTAVPSQSNAIRR